MGEEGKREGKGEVKEGGERAGGDRSSGKVIDLTSHPSTVRQSASSVVFLGLGKRDTMLPVTQFHLPVSLNPESLSIQVGPSPIPLCSPPVF